MGVILGRAHSTESWADVHQRGDDRTHGGQIIHLVHDHHKAPPGQDQENVNDKITHGQIDDLRLHRAPVQSNGHDRHGPEKDALDGCDAKFADKDIVNDFNTAGG